LDSHLNETDVTEYAQDLLLETQDVGDFLNELARYSADNLSGPHGQVHCGITLLRRRSAATVQAIDAAAAAANNASRISEMDTRFECNPV